MYESKPNGAGGYEEQTAVNAGNGFDSLSNVPFAGAQADIPTKRLVMSPELSGVLSEDNKASLSRERLERLAENMERQKRKLVAALGGSEGFNAIGRSEVGAITDNMQEKAYMTLRGGSFTREIENEVLVPIGSPMDKVVGGENAIENVANKVLSDPGMAQILGAATIEGYDGSTIPPDYGRRLIEAIRTYCPSPADFFDRFSGVMQNQFESNSDEYASFKDDTENFMESVYGKRYQYWKALNSLKNEASQYEQKYAPEALHVYSVPAEMQEQMMRAAKIEGDNYKYGGQEYALTPEYLAQYGFGPEFMARFEGAEIGLSRVFKNSTGRNVALGYVRRGNDYCVRSYYKSHSQGIWRLMADYAVNASTGEGIGWYGKGFSEEQLVLPAELQEALSVVEEQGLREDVNPATGDFLLCGTAYRYGSKEAYVWAKAQNNLRGDVYRETSPTPAYSMGKLNFDKSAPQDVRLEGGLDIDTNDIVQPKYSCDTAYYGKVDVFLADSKDHNLRYSVLRNAEGKRWFGGAEVKHSPINSCGLRRDWVELGDLSTPLIEYTVMAGKYGEPSQKIPSHNEMWSYLSRVPAVREVIRKDYDNMIEDLQMLGAS